VHPERCPCGSGEAYADCCGPLHTGAAEAPTARALMASRFTAFALRDAPYLQRTWHPSTRPPALALDGGPRWTRLEIVDVVGGGPFETAGVVEFRAHYRGGVLRERSRFVREDGRWYYVDGDVG
jgi:SEC-C motif-containing protein